MLPPRTQVTVALLGFGNVGRAFARYVESNADARGVDIRIRAIADSSGSLFLDRDDRIERVMAHKESSGCLCDVAYDTPLTGAREFVDSLKPAGISTLVESLPTDIASGEPALGLISAALERGVNVVTVDKGPLVHGFATLNEAASRGRSRFRYTGTTGVCATDTVLRDRVLEIRGVLNGTTNYILTEMQQRERAFIDALAQAQAEGVAEPDPSLDVEGWDTACKILILAKSLMGADARLADVSRIGIGPETESLIQTAQQTGRVVRLVGRARVWQGRVRVSVAPKLVEPDSPFYSVEGTAKAAVFRTEGRGAVLAFAKSGRDAISQTIVDDIEKIATERDLLHSS